MSDTKLTLETADRDLAELDDLLGAHLDSPGVPEWPAMRRLFVGLIGACRERRAPRQGLAPELDSLRIDISQETTASVDVEALRRLADELEAPGTHSDAHAIRVAIGDTPSSLPPTRSSRVRVGTVMPEPCREPPAHPPSSPTAEHVDIPRHLVVRAREKLKEAGLIGSAREVDGVLAEADRLRSPTAEPDKKPDARLNRSTEAREQESPLLSASDSGAPTGPGWPTASEVKNATGFDLDSLGERRSLERWAPGYGSTYEEPDATYREKLLAKQSRGWGRARVENAILSWFKPLVDLGSAEGIEDAKQVHQLVGHLLRGGPCIQGSDDAVDKLREHLTETVWLAAEAYGADRECPDCQRVVQLLRGRVENELIICVKHYDPAPPVDVEALRAILAAEEAAADPTKTSGPRRLEAADRVRRLRAVLGDA